MASSGNIEGIAFSRDGSLLAIAEEDGSIGLWNSATGQLERTLNLEEHRTHAGLIPLFPKGDALASLGLPQDLLIWDPGKERVCLRAGDHRLSLTPDGRYMATSFGHWVEGTTIVEGGVRVWNTETGERVFSQPWTTDRGISGLAFSPDGTTLAAASRWSEARLWEVATGKLQQSLELQVRISHVVFSPDGQFLVVGGVGRVDGLHAVTFWDLAAHSKRAILKDEKEGDAFVNCCAFSPDGRIFVVGGQLITWYGAPGRIKLWDVATGKGVCTIACKKVVDRVAFAPDGKTLAAVENNWPKPELAHVWDVSKLVPQTPGR